MKNPLINIALHKAFYRSQRTASSNTLGHVLIGKVLKKTKNNIVFL